MTISITSDLYRPSEGLHCPLEGPHDYKSALNDFRRTLTHYHRALTDGTTRVLTKHRSCHQRAFTGPIKRPSLMNRVESALCSFQKWSLINQFNEGFGGTSLTTRTQRVLSILIHQRYCVREADHPPHYSEGPFIHTLCHLLSWFEFQFAESYKIRASCTFFSQKLLDILKRFFYG